MSPVLTMSRQMPCHTTCPKQLLYPCWEFVFTSFNPLAKCWGSKSDAPDPFQTQATHMGTWLHEHLFRERAIVLGHALDNSTRTTYSFHLQSYLTFCKLHDFLLEPSADTLSFYIVFMAHHIKPNSVSQYISGIISSLEPHFPNVHDIHNGLLMSHTLAGIRKL